MSDLDSAQSWNIKQDLPSRESSYKPEEIVQQYTALGLADVYSVISYYLQHRPEVEAYLEERPAQRDCVRKEIESRFDPHGIPDRLLTRAVRELPRVCFRWRLTRISTTES